MLNFNLVCVIINTWIFVHFSNTCTQIIQTNSLLFNLNINQEEAMLQTKKFIAYVVNLPKALKEEKNHDISEIRQSIENRRNK